MSCILNRIQFVHFFTSWPLGGQYKNALAALEKMHFCVRETLKYEGTKPDFHALACSNI